MTTEQQSDTRALRYRLEPADRLQGTLTVPGDKSMSHRSVMFGSLASGTTRVHGFLEGEDSLRTLAVFRQLGVEIEHPADGELIIHGQGAEALRPSDEPLYLGNSGTAMRLLSGVLAGAGIESVLTGDESLSRRPMRRVTDPLGEMGAHIETAENGVPPLHIHAGHPLTGIDYVCPMASAQVKSAVLLGGLFARGTTRVLEPAITRDHTERMLNGFGVEVRVDGLSVAIEGGQTLTATELTVPGDISSAAFFLVGAAMTPGSEITVTGVGVNPTRTGVLDILRLMGADVSLTNTRESGGEPVADIHVRGARLKGIEVPESLVSLAIDEFPMLFVAAAAAEGDTLVTGAEELRVKEVDRIQVVVDGLRAIGVDADARPDGALIRGTGGRLGGGTVDSAGDHRVAMAFAMASLLSDAPITVLDCDNVSTSFPNFPALAARAGLTLREERG